MRKERRKHMRLDKVDLAGLLPVAGMMLTALGYLLEAQQRKQDNKEIAAEVARILKGE